ncbi:MAG: response regulator [Planctomycetes bacterium]|nr:response regulator [Planctomycetota bacterium]
MSCDYLSHLDAASSRCCGEGDPLEVLRARMASCPGIATTTALAPFEEQIRRAQKMETVSTLAAGISHHFNNLLMGILGASRLAARQLDDEHPALPYLAEIAAAADRGAELTRKLVDFGRPRQPQLRPMRVVDAIEGARGVLRDLLPEDVRLSVILGAPEARVIADPEQLEQILVNLTLNARDALPSGGEVSIAACALELGEASPHLLARMKPGSYVEISVRDTGCGMDEATRARIFEPFFTTKPEGTGLGLYIVYGVLASLGGRIEVDSQLGAGTTFRLLLPAYQPPPAPAVAPDRKPRILVVEDERLIRITLRHTLQREGFEVLCAGDAVEARAVLRDVGYPDVLLSDMILPGASGTDLAQEVVLANPATRVVFMSAYPRDVLLAQGRIDASARTLEKPFGEDTLLAVLRDSLIGASN